MHPAPGLYVNVNNITNKAITGKRAELPIGILKHAAVMANMNVPPHKEARRRNRRPRSLCELSVSKSSLSSSSSSSKDGKSSSPASSGISSLLAADVSEFCSGASSRLLPLVSCSFICLPTSSLADLAGEDSTRKYAMVENSAFAAPNPIPNL